MSKEEPILIIDGDILNFTICRTTEDITDFDGDIMKSFDKEATIRLLESGLDDISKKTGYDREDIMFAITSETNFRKALFPTYKNNRKAVTKPLGLPFIRNYLLENAKKYNTIMIETLEAD